MSQHTAMQKPPMEKSDEANPEQLDMAREQGDTYLKALKKMANHEADDGGMKPAGDYVVAYAVESAEGMYQTRNGELEWQEPQSENVHVEVSVRDAADNRFIPGLTVYATVIDADDNVIGRHEQPFLWHPWLYHYGRNWEVPGDGIYKLRVEIEAPKFGRHDKKNGRRFAENVTVEFDDVKIEAGQKK